MKIPVVTQMARVQMLRPDASVRPPARQPWTPSPGPEAEDPSPRDKQAAVMPGALVGHLLLSELAGALLRAMQLQVAFGRQNKIGNEEPRKK